MPPRARIKLLKMPRTVQVLERVRTTVANLKLTILPTIVNNESRQFFIHWIRIYECRAFLTLTTEPGARANIFSTDRCRFTNMMLTIVNSTR